jgi:glyoxylase-like metal-dependent hydrolase (beta-lactamase superfamily II)
MERQSRRLGNLEIMRALEMIMPFDAATFFPSARAEDWARHADWLGPDAYSPASNAVLFTMQSYIVRTSYHTILIDACVGNDKERPHRSMWHHRTDDAYLSALARHGLHPEDIDIVMCTHLHTDHVGWNTRLRNGRWVPTFPNARYVFSRKEYDAWDANCDPKFSRQHFEDSVLPVVQAGRAELVANDFALDDEVWFESTPGHTPDHVAIHFASGDNRAVMCGDLLHSPVQLAEPDWEPWPDFDAALAKRTRRAFLERHCDTNTLVCTAHFPLPSAGRVVSAGDGFRFEFDSGDW